MKFQEKCFLTPPPPGLRSNRDSPLMPRSENSDLYHVIHKVPAGDSPYVRAKRAQMIDKDLGKAISLFWAAINSGDRVDSALKDMALVMKQLNRADEAIEAIRSFRRLCPPESQESIDNILLELYKRSGRMEEEIQMLHVKLNTIEEDFAFAGKRTKTSRLQGKKTQIPIEKEYSRLLGNLAWSYLQKSDYESAEEYYRKALSFEVDRNKQCNLALCLIHLKKMGEAELLLQSVKSSIEEGQIDESSRKSYECATQMLDDFKAQNPLKKAINHEKVMSRKCRLFTPCERRNFKRLSKPSRENNDSQGEQDFTSPLGNVRPIKSAENDLKFQTSRQEVENSPVNLQVSGSRGKSWADMVEQDELNELAEEKNVSDISMQTPYSSNQESLSKKIEVAGLNDGYYTQPIHDGSLKNQVAKRTLCFDQNQKLERVGTCFSSPLLNKNLNF